jgi:hypothetical protein
VNFEVGEEEITSGCRTKGERERFPDLRSRVGERTTADLGFDGRNGKQKLGTGSEKSGRGVGMKQVSEIGRIGFISN